MRSTVNSLVLLLGAALLAAGCERPPVKSTQQGYRGTGMVEIDNPRLVAKSAALHVAPPIDASASQDGPKAKDVYQNVKVLGDLSVAEFTRTMLAMTAWVSPAEGCNYCHNPANLADDSKYTKIVARRMTQMTQHLNADWKAHVADTGVTCYTCHRGNPVPANIWFKPEPNAKIKMLLGDDAGQNKAAPIVGLASLPYDPFGPYLTDNKAISAIRVNGPTPLPTGNRASTKQAEHTYALMMHMSQALGVNCTYCHNAHSFQGWEQKSRATAWHGIRMVGDLNANYVTPLTGSFPANRLGVTGDVAKINCATCHQGLNKPLGGAQMAKEYPALVAVSAVAAAPAPVAVADAPPPDIKGVLGKVLFEVGKSDLGPDAQAVIKAAAAMLATNPDVTVALSGFADKTGKPDANLELAKQRAFAVRDALKAAGVAESRVVLKKPEFVIGGAEADSRRVDIVAAAK
jgi:photosynthetic reaction center cytochrome c subunit